MLGNQKRNEVAPVRRGRGTGLVRREQSQNGRVKLTELTNFVARIVSDIIVDDGAEERRLCGVQAELDGQKKDFVVSATEFAHMGWVLQRLGPRAIIYPGQAQ